MIESWTLGVDSIKDAAGSDAVCVRDHVAVGVALRIHVPAHRDASTDLSGDLRDTGHVLHRNLSRCDSARGRTRDLIGPTIGLLVCSAAINGVSVIEVTKAQKYLRQSAKGGCGFFSQVTIVPTRRG